MAQDISQIKEQIKEAFGIYETPHTPPTTEQMIGDKRKVIMNTIVYKVDEKLALNAMYGKMMGGNRL